MATVAAEGVNRWRRTLLPGGLLLIGFLMFISGDLTGDHWIRIGGVVIIGASVLVAVAGAIAETQSRPSERGLLIVRPDQAALYECAVRAFGAARVRYDRRQGERRQNVSATAIERRQSERRQRADVDFDIRAFGSAWIRNQPINLKTWLAPK